MILAANDYPTNAALMLDCIALGYINPDEPILDPTYGKGVWWKGLDLDVTPFDINGTDDNGIIQADFRDLPIADNSFTQAVFDPPYVAVGGRKSSTINGFNEAYGLVDVPKTPDDLHELMVDGLVELRRVVENKGIVLFKAMNYVTSGRYCTQAYDALASATEGLFAPAPFRLRDEFIHLRRPGPQPPRDSQKHARRNYSHLFVLEVRK